MTSLPLRFVWLEITGKCQLACRHCYADSGLFGTHGTMTEDDWKRVIDEARETGARMIQFIGGEPTLHPSLALLIDYALQRGIAVEVFTNLLRISERMWTAFSAPGVHLATSYYSPVSGQHDAITKRQGSHGKTLANIWEAVDRGVPLRVGVIGVMQDQQVDEATAELTRLGVADVGVDYLRQVGRGIKTQKADIAQLCGKCADGTLAVSPDGDVWPCVFSRWLRLGNVLEAPLEDIHAGLAATGTRSDLKTAFAARTLPADGNSHPGRGCSPEPCEPSCSPRCGPTCNPIACRPRERWPSFEE